jgi:hypothetical protein
MTFIERPRLLRIGTDEDVAAANIECPIIRLQYRFRSVGAVAAQ